MKLIDTHCHLDSLKSISIQEELLLAKENGVEKIITIATEPEDLEITLELARVYKNDVWATQGIHPHQAINFSDDILEIMKNNVINNRSQIVAIGEIGLDYYYDFSPRKNQIDAFEKQLQLAKTLNLPVVIHSRDADDDMVDIIKNFYARENDSGNRRGVFHSYSSGLKLAQTILEEDFYCGFNGMITFAKASNVREIFEIVPLEKILLETDAPYLAPVPHRGKENAPHLLPFIAQKGAELKKISIEEFAEITFQNAMKLFQLSNL
ncbi:MAG: TatD family hydrolase [Oligoflexia bacterium]|nr:TatD family hydrolase [Oligoflexia bacterium]